MRDLTWVPSVWPESKLAYVGDYTLNVRPSPHVEGAWFYELRYRNTDMWVGASVRTEALAKHFVVEALRLHLESSLAQLPPLP